MNKFWRMLLLALLVNGLMVATALARPVYLADGGVIQAQKVWKEDGRIYLLLNRDSLISFAPEEVNLKKTFAKPTPRKPTAAPVAVKGPVATSAVASKVTPPTVTSTPAANQKPAAPVAVKAPVAAPSAASKPAPPVATAAPAANQKPAATPAAVKTPVAAPVASKSTLPVATPAPAAKTTALTVAVKGAATAPAVASAKPAPAATAAKPQAVTPTATAAKPAPPAKAVAPRPRPAPAVAPVPAENPLLGLAVIIPVLMIALLIIAALWKVFEKAGEAGWKSLIPIYNIFVLLNIAGCPSWWFILLLIPVVNLWFGAVMHIRLAEQFGKGTLFGLGLFFLGFIFFPILAFGSATYGTGETFLFDEEAGNSGEDEDLDIFDDDDHRAAP